MASLKEKFDNSMNNTEKTLATFYTSQLVSDLVGANINFNVQYWQIGSYMVIVPQNDGHNVGFYISDRVRLYHGQELVYASTYDDFNYDKMLDLFVNL